MKNVTLFVLFALLLTVTTANSAFANNGIGHPKSNSNIETVMTQHKASAVVGLVWKLKQSLRDNVTIYTGTVAPKADFAPTVASKTQQVLASHQAD